MKKNPAFAQTIFRTIHQNDTPRVYLTYQIHPQRPGVGLMNPHTKGTFL